MCAQFRESLGISCDVMDDVGEKSRTLMFIAEQKSIMLFEKADNLLHDISVKGKCSLRFKQNDGIRQSLRDLKRIGQIIKQTPNKIIECKRSRRYNVRMKDDIEDVLITGICESTNGQYVICDSRNKKLKLLDSAFQIISRLEVPGCIHGITSVDATKLVCSVSGKKLNLLYFVAVNVEGLEIVNYTDLPHDCRGICRRDEELYVSSINALYVYTLAGELLRKIDVNESIHSVHRCAVSLDGTRIYVTADDSTELVTLSNDGSLLSTFTDSEQRKMGNVHVTHNGQVLVCCWEDNSVIQLHNDGREQLAVLVTNGDGLYDPQTVYYSHATNKVIVGFNGDEIMVLDVK
ncbi:hypothetical protein DPMN_037900 [Dreissena polymorpha]|uniref:Uncharacterized protein n=2 Tax=Dreissena polymorpha TaxID=45954 RepID=A0A9D4RN74_DREPO|nr:hypothetical protein DPMN_037900 [Dreissena polymorpha]